MAGNARGRSGAPPRSSGRWPRSPSGCTSSGGPGAARRARAARRVLAGDGGDRTDHGRCSVWLDWCPTPASLEQVEFIYQVGPFSLIVALLAGAAGMTALTSAKSAGLVGVFISVTTVPAAGFASVAVVAGQYLWAAQSLLQLLVNLVGVHEHHAGPVTQCRVRVDLVGRGLAHRLRLTGQRRLLHL